MTKSNNKKKQEIREYFDDASLPDFGVDARFFPSVGKRLVEFAGIGAGNRVLDVATGRGANLFPAAEIIGMSGEVVGIDLAEGMVIATRKEIDARGIKNASIFVMDAENLEYGSGFFDVVLCGFALFFFPDLIQALNEFFRVLKSGGFLATTTFGRTDGQLHWYEELFRKHGLAREIPGFESLERPEELEFAFINSGFENIVISSESFDANYIDEHDWWSHLWNTADRKPLETLNEKDLDSLKVEAFHQIKKLETERGIRVPYNVLLTRGEKLRE